jgi:hypothetical protein
MKSHSNEIVNLLIKHLGPIPPVNNDDELIRRIIEVEYPNGKNIKAALAGLNISDRQRKPYHDALILGRIAGLNDEALVKYIKKNVVIYPGAQIIPSRAKG